MNIVRDALIGLAVGDALGVPVEFESRESLVANPVTDMRGYGTYSQAAGTWSDDSSLTFCLAESLTQEFNLANMAQKFVDWSEARIWTPHGRVFDIGITTSEAMEVLEDILISGDHDALQYLHHEADEMSNGNGSLMRILPLLFYPNASLLRTGLKSPGGYPPSPTGTSVRPLPAGITSALPGICGKVGTNATPTLKYAPKPGSYSVKKTLPSANSAFLIGWSSTALVFYLYLKFLQPGM